MAMNDNCNQWQYCRLSLWPRLHYLCVVALACLATLRYHNITWNYGMEEGEEAMFLQLHRQLDASFDRARQASSTSDASYSSLSTSGQFEDALLKPEDLSTDSDSHDHHNSGIISATCHDLGITPELVARSRILGNTDRWHNVIKKMNNEEEDAPVKVAILGGSVPAGTECEEGVNGGPQYACAWPAQLQSMMYENGLRNVDFVNLARGGVPSASGYTQVMGLQDYDVIIIQWTTNDDSLLGGRFGEELASQSEAHFETLIRTALSLPKNPAVILFESLGKRMLGVPKPAAEIMHYGIATVYDIPVVSARSAFWRLKSFDPHSWTWKSKSVHPNELWHKRFACLMYENWMQELNSKLDMSNWLDPLIDQPPVFGGSTMDCQKQFDASALEGTLELAPSSIGDGWVYYADAPNKFGYISNTTDSLLQFEIPPPNSNGNIQDATNNLFVHYLRSYTPEWGSAVISIEDNVRPVVIDSHTEVHASQVDVVKIGLKPSVDPYKVTIKNLGGKVKVVELFLYSCTSE